MSKRFNEFNIKSPAQKFTGDKVRISKILNREITVIDYSLEDSKFSEAGSKCLYLQIEINGTKNVIFTGSKSLISQIEQVPKSEFPFLATIEQEDQRFQFT